MIEVGPPVLVVHESLRHFVELHSFSVRHAVDDLQVPGLYDSTYIDSLRTTHENAGLPYEVADPAVEELIDTLHAIPGVLRVNMFRKTLRTYIEESMFIDWGHRGGEIRGALGALIMGKYPHVTELSFQSLPVRTITEPVLRQE